MSITALYTAIFVFRLIPRSFQNRVVNFPNALVAREIRFTILLSSDAFEFTSLPRYVKFFKSLLKSKSPEVALVANLVRNDRSSVTGANLEKISQETGIMSLTATTCQIMEALAPPEPPQNEMWRFPLLEKYLYQRSEMITEALDTKETDSLIDALCPT